MKEMDAPSMSSASSISNVPNEVLVEIFSYVRMDKVVKWSENGQERRIAQIVALLHVCRAFRMATFESHAFLDWEFDFTHLIPYRNTNNTRRIAPHTITRITRLLNTLLADQYLLQTLARKR
jgi:hypothetical protein